MDGLTFLFNEKNYGESDDEYNSDGEIDSDIEARLWGQLHYDQEEEEQKEAVSVSKEDTPVSTFLNVSKNLKTKLEAKNGETKSKKSKKTHKDKGKEELKDEGKEEHKDKGKEDRSKIEQFLVQTTPEAKKDHSKPSVINLVTTCSSDSESRSKAVAKSKKTVKGKEELIDLTEDSSKPTPKEYVTIHVDDSDSDAPTVRESEDIVRESEDNPAVVLSDSECSSNLSPLHEIQCDIATNILPETEFVKAWKQDTTLEDIMNSLGDCDWSLNPKDRYTEKQTAMKRYYSPMSNVNCRNCNKAGHLSKVCPEPVKHPACYWCGQKDHRKSECPEALCDNCKQSGHPTTACKAYKHSRFDTCRRCQMLGHRQDKCPDQWRRYHLTTEQTDDDPVHVDGSNQEMKRKSCSNCGSDRHFQYDCKQKLMNVRDRYIYTLITDYVLPKRFLEVAKDNGPGPPKKNKRKNKSGYFEYQPPVKKKRGNNPSTSASSNVDNAFESCQKLTSYAKQVLETWDSKPPGVSTTKKPFKKNKNRHSLPGETNQYSGKKNKNRRSLPNSHEFPERPGPNDLLPRGGSKNTNSANKPVSFNQQLHIDFQQHFGDMVNDGQFTANDFTPKGNSFPKQKKQKAKQKKQQMEVYDQSQFQTPQQDQSNYQGRPKGQYQGNRGRGRGKRWVNNNEWGPQEGQNPRGFKRSARFHNNNQKWR